MRTFLYQSKDLVSSCSPLCENEPLFFKRYGESEDVVRKELTSFIRQSYDESFHIESVEKDKTKTIKN